MRLLGQLFQLSDALVIDFSLHLGRVAAHPVIINWFLAFKHAKLQPE